MSQASALERLLKTGAKPSVLQNAFSVAGHPAAHDGHPNLCREGSRLYGSTDETLAAAQRAGITVTAYGRSAEWRRVASTPRLQAGSSVEL